MLVFVCNLTGCIHKNYKAAKSNYFLAYTYGTIESCWLKCQSTNKCVAFMYRHSDRMCWMYDSNKKLPTAAVNSMEFVEMECQSYGITTYL